MNLRKLLAGGLVVVTALSFWACGSDSGKKDSGKKDSGSAVSLGNYILVDEIENDDGKKTFVFANEGGTIKIDGYREVEGFYKNVGVAQNEDYEYALIDTKGKELIPFGKYKSIYMQDDYGDYYDLYKIEDEDGKYGIIDSAGKEIVPCDYEYVSTSFFINFYDENGQDTSVPFFECETDTDDVYDIYSRFGTKLISDYNAEFSDDIRYFSFDSKTENTGVFISSTEDNTKVDFISEKTGETILSLSDSEEVNYKAYDTGLVLCYKDDVDEVYMIAKDGTSAKKIFDEDFNYCYASDKYRIITIQFSKDDNYDDSAIVFDESGNICATVKNDGDFLIIGSGNDTKYFSQIGNTTYEVYDSDFKKTGELYDVYVCYSFYAARTEKSSTTYTIFDSKSKEIYKDAEYVSYNAFKVGDDKVIRDFGSIYEGKYSIFKENQESAGGLNPGYTFVRNIDGGKETYTINDYNGQICDLKSEHLPDTYKNVNLYNYGSKYYDYKGKLIYERKSDN